jgi:anti-sigma factor RsiW
MRCKKVIAQLEDHVDGLLPVPRSEEIRDHLDVCADCRETSMALKVTTSRLAEWSDDEPSADCFDRILARIEALPVEAYERPVMRHVSRMAYLDALSAARVRWFATSGLAAAAAVLATLVISHDVQHTPRRLSERQPAGTVVRNPEPSFQGYDFDDGLLYESSSGTPGVRTLRYVRPRLELLESRPR